MLSRVLSTAFLASLCLSGASAACDKRQEVSAGCGKNPTKTSGTYYTNVNGKQRQYIVKLPDNYDPNHPYMLIFTLHALNGNADQIANGGGGTLPYYGLPPLANNQAIFVSPNGLNSGWGNQGGEDITFLDTIMDELESDLCIDENLRFSTGFSYGGAMSYSLACSRPDKIRAIAVLSGGLLSGCDGGNQPVAYYGQHGTGDSVLNVNMGRQLRDTFVANNGCTPPSGEPQPGQQATKTEYQGCDEGYPVTWVVFNGDHNPSQTNPGSNVPFAPQNTWDFFSQFL